VKNTGAFDSHFLGLHPLKMTHPFLMDFLKIWINFM